MKYKLAILFTQPPFGTSISREGLDALLAASAFCEEEELAICFLNDGVFNLVAGQQPEQILQKDHIATFKLIELYDLTECIAERRLDNAEWVLNDVKKVSRNALFDVLHQADKVLTF